MRQFFIKRHIGEKISRGAAFLLLKKAVGCCIMNVYFCFAARQAGEEGKTTVMYRTGFDNDKYLKLQSEHIRKRIAEFGDKLYLEFGGKLFDDYHASRVLPGFEPDSKLRMLMQLSDQAEIVIVISAADIDKNKMRGDLGITYDSDLLRLKAIFESKNLYVGSVCITHYAGQYSAQMFQTRLEKMGVKVEVENMEFDSIIAAVQAGKADVGVAGMTVTPDREENVSFTQGYATSKQVIIVRKD